MKDYITARIENDFNSAMFGIDSETVSEWLDNAYDDVPAFVWYAVHALENYAINDNE